MQKSSHFNFPEPKPASQNSFSVPKTFFIYNRDHQEQHFKNWSQPLLDTVAWKVTERINPVSNQQATKSLLADWSL